ncbi:MAG TPA: EAL domain-containing protein [Gammaproteobacteria bacterium]|nr:EAL domain-containing protein [Gammaproteobacteria bacterium]
MTGDGFDAAVFPAAAEGRPASEILPAASDRKVERRYARQRVYFRTLFENLADGVAVLDTHGRIVTVNHAFQALFQYEPAELYGLPIDGRIVPEHLHAEAESLSRQVLDDQVVDLETMRRRKDGRAVPVRIRAFPIVFGVEQAGMYVVYADISQRRQAQVALQSHQELTQVLLAAIGDGVIRLDAEGRVRYMNGVAERLTGWTQAEAAGLPAGEVCVALDEATRARRGAPAPASDADIASLLIARDGRETPVNYSCAPMLSGDGHLSGALIVLRDNTETRRVAEQLAWQATHDSLTGLPNRIEFERRLGAVLDSIGESGAEHSMLYLDLDQFKIVNDICGHRVGDELLRQLTALLAADIRDTDTLARLGGDEFGVLLTGCTAAHAERLAHKLIHVIEDFRFVWDQRVFAVGASIGVVAINKHCSSLSELFAAADSACYSAKERGRNGVRVYRSDARDLARRHDEMGWVSRITQAIEADRFVLYHQQISPLHGGTRPHCSEILLRLRGDGGEIIAPGRFIPAAERYHLMPALDRWVIRRVFAGLQRQLAEGRGETVAINVSGATISEGRFVDFVRDQFCEFGIPPQSICFEITETAAISNLDEASAFVDQIRELGCTISLDDFGSGSSSFTYLKTLHVDYLKIDGTFVRNMVEDPIDCAMVETINRVGKIMGVKTVAEYVEVRDVLDKLREFDVDFVQGFDIHRPEPWAWAN